MANENDISPLTYVMSLDTELLDEYNEFCATNNLPVIDEASATLFLQEKESLVSQFATESI